MGMVLYGIIPVGSKYRTEHTVRHYFSCSLIIPTYVRTYVSTYAKYSKKERLQKDAINNDNCYPGKTVLG